MPVGIGFGRDVELRPGITPPTRFSGPPGVHASALWIAAAAPALAILLLVARLAS